VKFLAHLATLLLTLVGYSSGVVLKSGKTSVRKPVNLDLALVVLVLVGMILIFSQSSAVGPFIYSLF